jgi:hypothetical protein
LTRPADGNACNAHDEEINLSGEQYRAYKDSLTEEEKKSLLEDLAESKNIKEYGVRATNKAVALDAMQTTSQIGKVVHFVLIIAIHATALTVFYCRSLLFIPARRCAVLLCSRAGTPTTQPCRLSLSWTKQASSLRTHLTALYGTLCENTSCGLATATKVHTI